MKKPKVYFVLGPTASGKSERAVELALKLDGEIISADSRQIYRGLDIGTGKVTHRETQGVPHHLIDILNPKESFSSSDFVRLANAKIKEICERGRVPIICGGTNYYIEALLGWKNIPEVKPNEMLRTMLEKQPTSELLAHLTALDPDRARTIDSHNRRRLIRALEIVEALGKVPPIESQDRRKQPYECKFIFINLDDTELRIRIENRIRRRLEDGMIEEVERLHARGLSYKRMIELGLEYKLISQFLVARNRTKSVEKKEELVSQLESALNREIWHYAKNQKRWLKGIKSRQKVDVGSSL